MRSLRPHQAEAVSQLRASLREGFKRPLLMLPTGAGKTLTAAHIAGSVLDRGKRATFVVPALALIDQTVDAFWAEGLRDIGVIQASHGLTRPRAKLQVASVQTLARRELPETDLVIVDEAHLAHKVVLDWMATAPNLPFIGLSATPWTRGLGQHYDDLIKPVSLAELIALKFLTPFRVFAPSHPDLSGARIVGGDYREDDASAAMQPLTGDVVSTWLERGEGRPTLCFAVDRAHAKHLSERFEAAGVSTAYVDGESTKPEREAIRTRFASGEVKVVCNVGVLTTGVDWDVRCIVLARPTKSEMLYVQMIGRGLRTAKGKADCTILDHSDTTLRLGFVTDIHHDRLDMGDAKSAEEKASVEREREERLPHACPSCGAVKPARARLCGVCGHEAAVKAAGVETRDGHLEELGKAAKKANREVDWPQKVEFIRQLRAYAVSKGKADGWVAHRYKTKFGCWPNDPRVRYAEPASGVGTEVAGWIKAQNIRFVRGRQREAA